MKTLIISSSLSKKSKSFILCKKVEEKLKDLGVQTNFFDAKVIQLMPYHIKNSKGMEELSKEIEVCDNIIIGMGVYCYSINDSLKIILDNCFSGAKGKFFGIICSAGTEKSYLSTIHLTQICMNEFKMIQLPQIIYAIEQTDFKNEMIFNNEIIRRINNFSKEFKRIGEKLL